MRIRDVVRFKDELFFNGSVEIDCIFDDRPLAQRAADSFVFHSRKSFTSTDDGQIDTIQLTKEIFDRAYSTGEETNLINAISGYGSGKSHYCTAIAALFANNKKFLKAETVLQNIETIDPKIYENICSYLTKPNIVFAINGMENKDLTTQMYQQIKQYLEISDVSISLFDDIERVFERAEFFVRENYENNNFQTALQSLLQQEPYVGIDSSKEALCKNIREDKVFGLVNDISLENTSHRFKIENYLNPRLILEEVSEKLCGEGKPFDKTIVIFDEIGRYIEWIADKASMDASSMQQLYEGVNNSSGNVIFLSFIQFHLSTYFHDLDSKQYKAVSPYVDRYKSAQNFSLSTLLETVFANLVEISDSKNFVDYSDLHKDLLRWNPDLQTKSIWSDENYYQNVICGRLRVFHPLTIALLAKLSEYTQKRGPLAILKELLDKYRNELVENINSIVPVSILNTSFKGDIVRMEQKGGAFKSASVYNYDQLVSREGISSHLRVEDDLFLRAVLIISLLQLRPNSKDDYYVLLHHLTGQNITVLKDCEKHLALQLGVLRYDDELHYHSIVLDSVGQKDFDTYFIHKRMKIIDEGTVYHAGTLSSKLQIIFSKELEPFKTRMFSSIATLEWEFPQVIRDIRDEIPQYLKRKLVEHQQIVEPNQPRGAMVWLYFNEKFTNDTDEVLWKLQDLSEDLDLDSSAIQTAVIVDSAGVLFDLIVDYDTINSFSDIEREKFLSFVSTREREITIALQGSFRELQSSALYLNKNKLAKRDKRFSSVVNEKVERLYHKYVPFNFEGFAVKNYHNGRREIVQIIKSFEQANPSVKTFKTILQDKTFNRLSSLLGKYGWGVFENEALGEPKDEKVLYAYRYVDNMLAGISEKVSLDLLTVFETLVEMPYGMNVYSATLLIVLTASFRRDYFSFRVDELNLRFSEWVLFVHEQNNTDIRIIKSTTIEYFDIKQREEAVNNIVQRILDEHSMIAVLNLDTSNGYLLDESYDSDELNSKIIAAKQKIETAKRLAASFKTHKDFQKEFELFIDQRETGVPDILKEIKNLVSSWEAFEDEVKEALFTIPLEWEKDLKVLLQDARRSVSQYFEEWFARNKAPVNHNVDPFIAFNKKIEDGLYSLGFESFARKVNANIEDISERYNLISQVNARVSAVTGSSVPKSISECKSQLIRIHQLRGDITVFDLKKHHKQEYFNQLDVIESRVQEQLDAFNNEVGAVWNFLAEKEVQTISELNKFLESLAKTLESIGEEHSDYKYLFEIFENGQEVQSSLLKVKDTFVDRQDVQKQMEVLRTQFSGNIEDDSESLTCEALFDEFEANLYQKIVQDSHLWVSELPDDETIAALGDRSLEQHLQYINNQPNFLEASDREIAQEKKLVILRQLDSHMHDEIVSLFNNIATYEKKVELIKTLQNQLK